MMGRNDPDTAALLGALPPHRNSPELVEIALAANKAVDEVHRSIHRGTIRNIARAGTTAAITCRTRAPACRRCSSRRCCTPDYHTPFDNPDRIDVAKLTKMTRWMYATGRAVAEADKRAGGRSGLQARALPRSRGLLRGLTIVRGFRTAVPGSKNPRGAISSPIMLSSERFQNVAVIAADALVDVHDPEGV